MKLLHLVNSRIRNKKGSSLIFVLLVSLVVLVLGLSLFGVTASNFNLSANERDFQSVYYIAEAGINYKLNDIENEIDNFYKETNNAADFFSRFESYLATTTVLNSFEDTFGKEPEVNVSVTLLENISELERRYAITSKGTIGNKIRTVENEIVLEWIPSTGSIPEAFIYGDKFSFNGSKVYGADATVVVNGSLHTKDFNGGSFNGISNIYIDGDLTLASGITMGSSDLPGDIYINGDLILGGGAALHGNVYVAGNLRTTNGSINNGKIYAQSNGSLENGTIRGDVYIGGNTKIVNATIDGTVYSSGDLILDWIPKGAFNIEYKGSLSHPPNYSNSILSKVRKVTFIPPIPTFKVPEYNLTLKDDEWYRKNGYSVQGNVIQHPIPQNIKILADKYTSTGWQSSLSGNITIVSKSDIIISGKQSLTGVLIAPNGKVVLDHGGSSFSGVVMTKDGFFFASGGSVLRAMKLSDFYSSLADIPFLIEGVSDGDYTITAKDLIKSVEPIREK